MERRGILPLDAIEIGALTESTVRVIDKYDLDISTLPEIALASTVITIALSRMGTEPRTLGQLMPAPNDDGANGHGN